MSDSDSDSDHSSWQQVRHYKDHLGHPVVLEEYVRPGNPPAPCHLVPIQVYSLVPLDPDHEKVRDYLLGAFWNDEVMPLFEIYSYCPPDAFACIDHNRREIAFRKQQHRSGVENAPGLIPQFFRHRWNNEPPIGRCVLLRSHCYRLDEDDDGASAGGPDALEFTRTFSATRRDADDAPDDAQIPSYPPDERFLERFELSVSRITSREDVDQVVVLDMFLNSHPRGELYFGLDVDEGNPPDQAPPSEKQIRDQLSQQTAVGGFTLPSLAEVTQDGGIVTVSDTPKGAQPDMQYLICAPFLSHLDATTATPLLESTARLFCSALQFHLPSPKTMDLEFSIPESHSNPWSGIRAAHDAVRASRTTEFAPGALHKFAANDGDIAALHRVSPQNELDSLAGAQNVLTFPCGVFAVVLDRANFVSEAGVYFYVADFGDDEDSEEENLSDDTKVWRCIGMAEAARRLAMLAVEEALTS
ncbi:hypothetical protein ASPVEDRAFT_53586 [Aspergillus versicolor CBS 583.65]|uniref:Uncharacterized protein n=1 Tax=Aspergillus versicolor CBS 583.65 TaxID=1036611 RepID=A0A1L9PNP0_ASPVE|nr:uncharacterized protein ASPVEDRAFT_53586 [Aspergillus versicolor CBS 583.65]OJJ03025.1 hypothetical protein ASPVEDRAFT_53586 [Aspergillus versicolor CBS 583.65]